MRGLFRSLRPDFIETGFGAGRENQPESLFRSLRPDFIETNNDLAMRTFGLLIVPVSKTGLH